MRGSSTALLRVQGNLCLCIHLYTFNSIYYWLNHINNKHNSKKFLSECTHKLPCPLEELC